MESSKVVVFALSAEKIQAELKKPAANRKAFFAVFEQVEKNCFYRKAWRGANPCRTWNGVCGLMTQGGYERKD